jgi:hypothetical protein
MTSPAPKRPRGGQPLPDDERRVLVRTRILPGSLAAVRAICEEKRMPEAAVLRKAIEWYLESLGETRCRACGVDMPDMPPYRQGEPRTRCDVCEER